MTSAGQLADDVTVTITVTITVTVTVETILSLQVTAVPPCQDPFETTNDSGAITLRPL